MLDKQIQYYRKNKQTFLEMYEGKYIVIKNKAVIGCYDSHQQAYLETIKEHEVGSFIIECPARKKISGENGN